MREKEQFLSHMSRADFICHMAPKTIRHAANWKFTEIAARPCQLASQRVLNACYYATWRQSNLFSWASFMHGGRLMTAWCENTSTPLCPADTPAKQSCQSHLS